MPLIKTVTRLPVRIPGITGQYGTVPLPTAEEAAVRDIRIPKSSQLPSGGSLVRYFLDMDPKFIAVDPVSGRTGVRCRASGKFFTARGNEPFPTPATGINGKPTLLFDGTQSLSCLSGTPYNKDSFTIMMAVRLGDPVAGATNQIMWAGDAGVASASEPPTGYASSTLFGTHTGGVSSLSTPGDFLNQDLLLGLTFSTTYGTALWRNGTERMRSGTRVTPPTAPNLIFGRVTNTGTMTGHAAKILVLDGDMTDPTYTAQVNKAIDEFLATYAIVKGS